MIKFKIRLQSTFFLLLLSSQVLAWGKNAVDNAIRQYSTRIEPRLIQLFNKSQLIYPPQNIALLAFKKERKMELWAQAVDHSWRYIHTYPLTAFSGHLGPKLRALDGQIPEGIYRIIALNPFSSMHLSIKIDYPNQFDKLHAFNDGRHNLGDNIFLHGKNRSVGCLAIGDRAIEQLFLLIYRVGVEHVKIIIAPNDLRHGKAKTKLTQPHWLPKLYKKIAKSLGIFTINLQPV